MIPILYKETEKEFRSNGIGQLDETIISETTEVLNGEFELYLEYPSTGQWFNEIKEFRYIQVIPNNQDEEHAFRIYEIDKTDDPESVKVYATTKSNELGDNLIEGFEYKKASPTMLYSQIKKSMLLPSNYNFVTDLTTLGNIDWKFRSPLNCILGEEGSMIQIFGGEIKRTNDYIYHYKRRGKDRVTSVRQDKNLDGFTQTVSTKGLVTKILPYYTYYPTPPEGFKGPVEPETMVIPIVTSAKAKDYPKEVLKAVDFSSYSDEIGATKTITKTEKLKNGKDKVTKTEVFDEKKTRENLIAKADTYFTSMYKGVDEPKVTIDVDLYSLADSAEYADLASLEHIGISDTVDVWVPKYDIDVTVKVKRLVFDNLTEKVISLSAGSSSTSTYQSQKGDYTQITDDIQAYIDSALDNTVHMAANGSNRIWTGATRPTEGVREGDTWFEPLPDGHMAIHHFDGVEWIFVMDTTDTTDNANRIEEAMKEIAKAQKAADDANKEINDAITNAGFTSLDEVINNVKAISTQAQKDADEAVIQALDAIAQALTAVENTNSLSVRVDEVAGTLSIKADKQTVDDLVGVVDLQSLDIQTNAEGLELKANQSVVDTLAGTVSSLGTEVNTVAGQITSKVWNVDIENAIDGIEVDIDTDTIVSRIEARWTQTFDTFDQTITDIDGRVTTQKQTIDGITRTVSGHDGRLSTVEQTVSGLQTTVAGKAAQSQVTQLANGYNVLVSKVNNVVGANLIEADKLTVGSISTNNGNDITSSDEMRTPHIDVEGATEVTIASNETDPFYYKAYIHFYDVSKNYLGNIYVFTEIYPEDIGSFQLPYGTRYIRMNGHEDRMASTYKLEIGPKHTGFIGFNTDEIYSQISALERNINLRVVKGDVMSQINIEAGRTLIQSDKLVINASTTTISGTAYMDGAVLKNLSVDGAKLKNATIANAKIVSLDAGKVSFGTMKGVRIEAETGTIGDWILDGGVLHSPLIGGGYTSLKATGSVALATGTPDPFSTTGANLQIWHDGTLRFGELGTRIYSTIQDNLRIMSHNRIVLMANSTVETDSRIIPQTNGNLNLGELTNRWSSVYSNSFRTANGSFQPTKQSGSNPNSSEIHTKVNLELVPEGQVYSRANILPWSSNNHYVGSSSYRWKGVYLSTQPNVSSDMRDKKLIQDIPKGLLDHLIEIKPKMYQQKDKWHFGYIAQDVERAIYKYVSLMKKWDSMEAMNEYARSFAMLHKDESKLSLLYGEITVIKEAEIQSRIDKLENKLEELLNAN